MLGFIDVPLFFLLSLISIIDKGFKFIPCLHINIFHIFMHLLSNINSETIHFNRQINIKNSYSSSHSDSFSNSSIPSSYSSTSTSTNDYAMINDYVKDFSVFC